MPSLYSRKILVADSDCSLTKIYQYYLKKFGFNTVSVHDGQNLVDAVHNDPLIYLVMMETVLPVLDGYSAARQIKQYDADISIIALTTNVISAAENDKRCFDAYLVKPFSMLSFLNAVKDCSFTGLEKRMSPP